MDSMSIAILGRNYGLALLEEARCQHILKDASAALLDASERRRIVLETLNRAVADFVIGKEHSLDSK